MALVSVGKCGPDDGRTRIIVVCSSGIFHVTRSEMYEQWAQETLVYRDSDQERFVGPRTGTSTACDARLQVVLVPTEQRWIKRQKGRDIIEALPAEGAPIVRSVGEGCGIVAHSE